jgi:hypothetical protein
MSNSFHLAGIVPAASRPTGVNLPWSDNLVPVAPNYFAIEYAVHQAAWAGCETIWVVCEQSATPLIRRRMGDFTYDPTSIGSKKLSRQPDQWRKLIPIYYVPIRVQDAHKDQCLPWSIIEGAMVANRICGQISKWTKPQRFFVSFPFGIYPHQAVRPFRTVLSNPTKPNLFFTHNGMSVKTENQLPFSFGQAELDTFLDNFKMFENSMISGQMLEECKAVFTDDTDLAILYDGNELPLDNTLEVDWFHQIDTWQGYKTFLGSSVSDQIRFPGRIFISYHEWNPIAEDLEDATEEDDNDADDSRE